MRSLFATALAAGLLLFAGMVVADTPLTYDRVNLSVSVEEDVANDTLVALLFVQREGQRQSQVSDEVNRTMTWALDKARGVAAVKAQTMSYSTSPVYSDRRVVGWRARQSIRLESRDSDALGKLMGELQERLGVQSVGYEVSKRARDDVESRLIDRALAAFSARAQRVAASLGRPGYRIVHVDVSTGGFRPPPVAFRGQMAARAEAAVAAPALEAGEQAVSVSVSGTIELDAPR